MKKSLEPAKTEHSRIEWFRTRILRQTLVPERHVLVVKKHGQFERLLPPGYHRISRWRRTKGNMILTGVRVIETDPIPCRSNDRIHFDLRAKARFFFKPTTLDQSDPIQKSILIELTELPDHAINGMVRDKVAVALRTATGRFLAAELRSGSILHDLQRAVKTYAQQEVSRLGIELLGTIDILGVAPPSRIEHRTQDAAGWQDFGRTLESLPEEERQRIYDAQRLRELGRSGGNVRMYARDGENDRKPTRDPNYARRRTGNRRNADDAYRDDTDHT